jgi:hypothetical protein
MMPWPLTRRELDALTGGVLHISSLERLTDDDGTPRWRAELTRE